MLEYLNIEIIKNRFNFWKFKILTDCVILEINVLKLNLKKFYVVFCLINIKNHIIIFYFKITLDIIIR